MFVTIREVEVDDSPRRRRYGAAPLPAASTWRWLALVAATGAFAQHRLAAATDPLMTLIAGAGGPLGRGAAVVAGWSPMLLAIVGYAAVALRPAQRRAVVHDRLARNVVAVAVLASVLLGISDDVFATAALWTVLAAVAADAYLVVAAAVAAGQVGRAIAAPFAALVGLAALVAVLAIDGALAAAGVGSEAPAVVLVLAVAAVAIARGLRSADPVLPAVIATGLVVAADGTIGAAGAVAFGAGAVATAITIVIASTLGAPPHATAVARLRATRAATRAPRVPGARRAPTFADTIAHDRFARRRSDGVPAGASSTAPADAGVADVRRAA